MAAAVSGTEAIRTWDEHRIGIEALLARLGTNRERGLSLEECEQKHAEFGDNTLSKKDTVPWYCLFLKELTGYFQLLLWFGSLLCFIGYAIQTDKSDRSNLYLGWVLALVVIVTGIFSY